MDPLAIAASGMRSAADRLAVSAHNIANLQTTDFRPLESHQSDRPGGNGSQLQVTQTDAPREVELLDELVEQMRAKLQFKASARFFDTSAELSGTLLDMLA